MKSGKTSTGFEFNLEDSVLDDYELLEALGEIDDGNPLSAIKMVNMLLGEDQKNALKEHIRNKGGKVSAKKMLSEVMEIFKVCNEAKNS